MAYLHRLERRCLIFFPSAKLREVVFQKLDTVWDALLANEYSSDHIHNTVQPRMPKWFLHIKNIKNTHFHYFTMQNLSVLNNHPFDTVPDKIECYNATKIICKIIRALIWWSAVSQKSCNYIMSWTSYWPIRSQDQNYTFYIVLTNQHPGQEISIL